MWYFIAINNKVWTNYIKHYHQPYLVTLNWR